MPTDKAFEGELSDADRASRLHFTLSDIKRPADQKVAIFNSLREVRAAGRKAMLAETLHLLFLAWQEGAVNKSSFEAFEKAIKSYFGAAP